MEYEKLLNKLYDENIEVYEFPFKGKGKGYYFDNSIALNSKIDTEVERKCIIAEEYGHHKTSYGNITDQNDVNNRKQEHLARKVAASYLIDFFDIINAYENGYRTDYEIAEHIGVTDEFFLESIEYYKQIFGLKPKIIGNYHIYFEPRLMIIEK